jgi:hypothetical protein
VSHLEGVLTLVSDSGPWFRIQGRHVREDNAKPLGLRLALSAFSGVTLDVHFGAIMWIRAGWYPAHNTCQPTLVRLDHRCFGRWLRPWVGQTAL